MDASAIAPTWMLAFICVGNAWCNDASTLSWDVFTKRAPQNVVITSGNLWIALKPLSEVQSQLKNHGESKWFQQLLKQNSSSRNENSVSIYSTSCHSKPVQLSGYSFFFSVINLRYFTNYKQCRGKLLFLFLESNVLRHFCITLFYLSWACLFIYFLITKKKFSFFATVKRLFEPFLFKKF